MDGSCFQLHRNRVIEILKNGKLENSLIYMPSPPKPKESFTESDLPFIQEGIFYWLTGWEHPDSAIIIDVKLNHSILVTPAFDEEYEIWHGKALTNQEIIDKTGVNEVHQGADPEKLLAFYTSKNKSIKHRFLAFKLKPKIALPVDDFGTLICAVSIARRSKFDHEIQALQKASEVTSAALVEVMKYCRPEIKEKDLAAVFLFHGSLLGGSGLSFPITAASGPNGAHLHYSENSDLAHTGDMVLFDCGIYVEHYAGDITRTFPVNGTFSPIQRKAYNLLYRAQCALISYVKPQITLYDLENSMLVHIFEILRGLGVVDQFAQFNKEVAQLFCPHTTSHHIGVSVHDWFFYDGECLLTVDYSEAFKLIPNMVISIEPGIYFNAHLLNSNMKNPQFAGVNFEIALELAKTVCAIRIEDDILVTSDGCKVLSTCPKSLEEIEAIMNPQEE